MANASVTALVSRQSVAAALAAARQECEQHPAWLNAVNRAALNLEACGWMFDGETLITSSATIQGTRYAVTASACKCKAADSGRPCWHRAARRLLVKAAEMTALKRPQKSLTELQASADELFA